MSGGGSKQTKQKMKLPKWYENAAIGTIDMGNKVAEGGYIPYLGPDVAAQSPFTAAGLAGTDAMSAAFGMPTAGVAGQNYMPAAQEFAGGIKGYSSAPAFEQSMEALKAKYPSVYEFLSQFNKMNTPSLPGQSINPMQATPTQSKVDPQFNSLIAMLTGMGGIK